VLWILTITSRPFVNLINEVIRNLYAFYELLD